MALGSRTRTAALLAGYLLLAAIARAPDVWRPVDGTTWDAWREPDVAGIARSFFREGMDILRPRVDWRGDGPGFVESEFPLYPWAVAALYHAFGYREELARALSLAFSLTGGAVFFFLARRLLPPAGAAGALLFFALSPLGVRMSSAVQPEPLMAAASLAAVLFFLRWLDEGSWRFYAASLLATVVAILVKLPALHLGLFFAALCLDRYGLAALRRPSVWAFALASLLVPLAWYAHARGFWLEYGNSLGISNEAYARIGTGGVASAARAVPGILRIEATWVWLAGGVLGVVGLLAGRRLPAARVAVYWLAALAAFYLATGRTTGEEWAFYYHLISVPAASLAVGLGTLAVAGAVRGCRTSRRAALLATLAALAALAGGLLLAAGVGAAAVPARFRLLAAAAGVAPLGGIAVFGALQWTAGAGAARQSPCWPAFLGCLLVAGTLSSEVWRIATRRAPREPLGAYTCARAFAERVEPSALIVASGGFERNEVGAPSAHDAPYWFFWMDRRGFSLAVEQHSIERLESLRARSARYFVAEGARLAERPGFEGELRARYRLVASCGDDLLFSLDGR